MGKRGTDCRRRVTNCGMFGSRGRRMLTSFQPLYFNKKRAWLAKRVASDHFLRNVMQEEQPNFKVTDRRLFNPDGSPRDLPPEEQPVAKVEPTPEPAEPSAPVAEFTAPTEASAATEPVASDEPEETSDDELSEEELEGAQDPASFLNFLMSIASNAASALGMMEHPVTHKREVDMELGKHWIDVLGMLQTKTAGNLSKTEATILESWLSDLRMQYVSLSDSASASAPQPFSARDIVGGK